MEFRILGPVEVANERGTIEVDAQKQRALLGVLLLHPNEVVSSDRLTDELWGERPPATAANILHTYVSQLRKALGADVIATRSPGYVLRIDDDALDAERFRRLTAEARRLAENGEQEAAAVLYRQALALWRGPALADVVFESFARNEVERLEEERLGALTDRIDCELALGYHGELVAELETLVKQYPLREQLRTRLMLALYRSGRQADALAVYQDARRTLVDQLGLEPGRELQDLEQAILRHEQALEAPARTERARPSRRTWLIAAPGVVLLVALAAAAFIVLRSGSGGLSMVSPNAVGVIDADANRLVAEVPVGIDPDAVAVGGGAVWVANVEDETVTRIDPTTRQLVRTISIGGYPSDIAVGHGSVWVALGPLAQVSRIVPDQNEVTRPISALGKGVVCDRPSASVAVDPRAVWFACEAAYLGRVDSQTGTAARVGYEAGLLTSPSAVVPAFSDVAFGLGSLWLANRAGNSIVEVDPATNRRLWEITVGRAPAAIAVGPRSVWVANFDDDTVSRIEVAGRGRPVTVKTIAVGDGPFDIAVGEGGVWVVNSRDRTVSRIDPARNEVVATIALGNEPRRVAVGGGAVWVTVRARDEQGAP